MSRILLTGASGGLGYHLLTHPRAAENTIDALVRPDTDTARLTGLGVNRCISWEGLVESNLGEYDHVIHAAAYVHQSEQARDYAIHHREINRDLTSSLARACRTAGVPHFVFISTVAVFGRFSKGHLQDDEQPVPDDPYGQSKREAELALEGLAGETSGTGYTVLRLPMVYGPRIAGNFRTLVDAAARGRKLPLGRARAKRSFLYARNFSDAVYALIEQGAPPHSGMKTYFLTDRADRSSADLYNTIFKAFHGDRGVYPVPPGLLRCAGWAGSALEKVAGRSMPFSSRIFSRLFDEYRCDAEAFTREVGWTPAYTPEQGIEETVNAFRKQKEAA